MRVLPWELSIHPGSYPHGGEGNRAVGAGETTVCFGQASKPAGRNVSECRARLETTNAGADWRPIPGRLPRNSKTRPRRRRKRAGWKMTRMDSPRRRDLRSTGAEDRPAGVMATARWEGALRNRRGPLRRRVSTSTRTPRAGAAAGVGGARSTVDRRRKQSRREGRGPGSGVLPKEAR